MTRPEPVWETDYKVDRRKHHHRCKVCSRVIATGDRVLLALVTRGSVAIHVECADVSTGASDGTTYRDSITAWGLAGLKSRGWYVPELDTHY